jgi:transcriptional regulator GlxA family with amidase domain
VRDARRTAHGRGARIVGLCLGAFALVEAGLLDGREAVTHWSAAAELARRRPQVQVRSDVLWCDHRDVVTSAGVAAALDCCLHLVRADHGAAVAAAVARALVLAPHRAGSQAQFIPTAVPELREDDPVEHAMAWARTRLADPIDLDTWAATANMSRRTFTRHFRSRTASSPLQWLLLQRLDHARVLLETTDDTVDRVAARAGFGSPVTLRHHFHRVLGTTPASHRAAFAG